MRREDVEVVVGVTTSDRDDVLDEHERPPARSGVHVTAGVGRIGR